MKKSYKNSKSLIRIEQNNILKKEISILKGVKSVLNVGSFPMETDKENTNYRDYFKIKEYFTLDNCKGKLGESHYNIDLHNVESVGRVFDLVLCMSVLEHVKNPFTVAKQLNKITNKYLFIVVPFIFPFHQKEERGMKDYWRFTDNGLRELFCGLKEIWIRQTGSNVKKTKYGKDWDSKETAQGYIALFKK